MKEFVFLKRFLEVVQYILNCGFYLSSFFADKAEEVFDGLLCSWILGEALHNTMLL